MAERYERYRRSKRESRLRLPAPAETKEPTTYDPAKQAEGLTKRLEASGIDVEKATDKRNIIEKALNLTEDQNILFDVFEVLGRPQQAIFNGIKAVQEGKSFGEGFKSGLSGENYATFSSILNEAGLGEEDSFGVDDVIGFIGDVFLDPVDLGILAAGVVAAPVTGGTSLGAAGTTIAALNTATDAGKITSKFVNAATKAATATGKDLAKTVKNIGSRIKATAKTTARFYGDLGTNIVKGEGKEVARKLFSRKAIQLSNGQTVRKIAITDMTMQAFGGLIKKGGKAVNWTVRTGIIESFAENPSTYVQTWDNWLTAMKGHFNAAARLGDKLFTEAQIGISKMSFGTLFGDAWARKVNNQIDDIVEKTFKETITQPGFQGGGRTAQQIKEEIKERISRELTEFAEWKYAPKTTVSETLNHPEKYARPIDDAVHEQIKKAINSPAFASVKSTVAKSFTRGKAYEKQTRTLVNLLNVKQQTVVEALKLEKQQLLDQAQGAQQPLTPGQRARQFTQGSGAGQPIEELRKTVEGGQQPVTAKLSPSQRARQFVDQTAAGAPIEDIQKVVEGAENLSPEQIAKLEDINRRLSEAEAKLGLFGNISYTEAGYVAARNEIQEMLNTGVLTADEASIAQSILNKTQKAIDDDAFNIIDELYESVEFEGKQMFVLRKDAQTEKIIEAINDRVKVLNKIVDKDNVDLLVSSKKFIAGTDVETQLRKLLKEYGSEKELEDIFELVGDTWTMRDEQAFIELMDLTDPNLRFGNSIDGSRFLTDEEFAAIDAKFAPGFSNEQAYTEVIDNMETAMRWYDQRYGTKFADDTAGYIRHTITQEAKDMLHLDAAYRKTFGSPYEVGDSPVLIGNTRTFKGRKYDMTVAEANRVARFNTQRVLDAHAAKPFLSDEAFAQIQDRRFQNLFSEYFTDSLQDTLIKMNEYGSAINVMNTALVGGALSNKDIIRFVDPLEKVPAGFVKVDKKIVRDKVEAMSKVFRDNADMMKFLEDFVDSAEGSVALIDENVFKMIGRLGQSKDIGMLTKIMEKTNNFFKKTKVFSLGFHFKNLVGNASNLYLAGVNPAKIGPMLWEGIRSKKRANKLIDLFAEISADSTGAALARLSAKDQKLYKAYQIFTEGGFEEAGKYLFDLDELIKKNKDRYLKPGEKFKKGAQQLAEGKPGGLGQIIDSALQANVDLNNIVDSGYRMGYIMQLIEEGLDPVLDKALIIEKVKLALFDPGTLTAAEETYRKYIPFYTFAKKNLAFQMKNVFENPVRYNRFIKSVKSSWSAVGVDWRNDLQPYQKENLWLPVPLTAKDGKYYQLKTSFPLSDLGEFVQNPTQKLFASLTPLLRAPIELTMNQQFFSGQPIERFAGQRGRMLGDFGITARQEYLIGQTGADRPLIAAASVVDLLKNKDATSLAPTVYAQGDVEQARRSQAYDQLDELRGLFQYYKQEQIPIMTLAEIENLNKPRSSLAQRLQAIQSRRGR